MGRKERVLALKNGLEMVRYIHLCRRLELESDVVGQERATLESNQHNRV